VQRIDFGAALALGLITHTPCPRQDGAEDQVLKRAVALDLAGDVADHAAEISFELLRGPVGALELLGVGIALMLDQRELAHPRIGLAQFDAMPFRQPYQDLASAIRMRGGSAVADTFAGRVHVEWHETARVTPLGQLPFFIEYLEQGRLFDGWVSSCPPYLGGPNAPSKRDVLGTVLLSVLAGRWRYAHMTTLRCDPVNPPLLGMEKVVSEDAVRRGFDKIEETAGLTWLAAGATRLLRANASQPAVDTGRRCDGEAARNLSHGGRLRCESADGAHARLNNARAWIRVCP
jgi:hypothetical protein